MIIYGSILTEDQAAELSQIEWCDGVKFNPIQIGDVWYISEQEVIGCVSPELIWVRRLPIVEISVT